MAWNPKQPAFLPSGVELAGFLADQSEFPGKDAYERADLAKVSSYYVDVAGRRTLCEQLREVLLRPSPSGTVHEFLASIQVPLLIVVSNYDTLMEQACLAAGRPYDLVVYATDRQEIANAVLWWPHGATEPVVKAPNELDINLEQRTVIYKMHGSLVPGDKRLDSFVITEEDYVDFLSRLTMSSAVPSLFFPYVRERSLLFLGYSLRDWNLRVVLKNLSKSLSRRVSAGDGDDELLSWAIQSGPSELERELWTKRGVKIFDVTVDEFVERIRRGTGP